MSFNINLYTFSKRRNSTKQPTGTGTSVPITYKEGSNLHSPRIELYGHNGDGGNIPFNYAEIEGNYYYITNAIYPDSVHCELSLELDVLATYKEDILTSTQFVEYSSSQVNVNISDTRFVTSNTLHSKNTTIQSPITKSGFGQGGLFLLTYAGKIDSPQPYTGMVSTVAMTTANMYQLNKALMETDWTEETNAELLKVFQSPYSALISCRYAGNVEIGSALGGSQTVWLGNWNSGISASPISTRFINEMILLPIPWQYADWRSGGGYTTIQINLPGFGLVEISPADCYKVQNLECHMLLDAVTGDLTYKIRTPDTVVEGPPTVVIEGTILSTATCNVYAEVPLAFLTQSKQQAIGNVGLQVIEKATSMESVKSYLNFALFGGSSSPMAHLFESGATQLADKISGTIGSIGDSQLGSMTTKGSVGNIGGLPLLGDIEIRTIAKVPDNYEQFNTLLGRPLMQARQLSTLSGYVQCRNASVALSRYNSINEGAEISNLLNGGIYIE